ncbi:hypothetical protein MUN74_12150 [Agromyces endophyticus]|uniref:hypothetical protein n=1 Tax=Agromyces sp. H17E-10 TaxID=2932244 RepID=UPI001FD2C311|nr:hypothetical protein [Agromyces sp. H17E-10]UOQ88044.1 hypothetical protein MUN74_12150 [Agromyces sp. H17E-10]
MSDEATMAVIKTDDGVLFLGSEKALSVFDSQSQLVARKMTSTTLARAGRALGAVDQIQANSGRWVKLTSESAAFLKKSGVSEVTSGVVRAKNGQILKHLKFEHAALLTPAAPAALAAMATQASLEAALAEIKEYLAAIDAKLDRLLKQRKIETLGQLGGVTLAIDEADSIYRETGVVSSVTWSKVQGNSLALQTMQAEAIAQLNALAEDVSERVGDTDASAKALEVAQNDAPFWLGVLARTLALQDRQYVLELARVADDEPSQLETHRQGIKVARADRTTRIIQSLEAIGSSVRKSAELTNFARVANPFSSQAVTNHANRLGQSVKDFAEHADLQLAGIDQLDQTRWGHAAKALLGDAASRVGSTSADVANRAKALGDQIQERRDDALLAKAEKVKDKRGVKPELAAEIGADPATAAADD